MKHKAENKNDYSQFKTKILFQLTGMVGIAALMIAILYILFWRGSGGEWIVSLFQRLFRVDYEAAVHLYQQSFRNNKEIIWLLAVAIMFFVLLLFFLSRFTRYFNEINRGIDGLLNDDETEISLPSEMSITEKKLNTAKQTLKKRALEAQIAEQRKNDLVMYLAHDIKTPLTSVIGYLSLLDEVPDMPPEQKAKYVHITLDKAYRLETMVNEFFEIARYNLQQMSLEKEMIDLYYMFVQLTDELLPTLSAKGNTTMLKIDENLTIYGDPAKLARVFNNILKNAIAYSYPNTEINIFAEKKENTLVITFQNEGQTILQEKLSAIFEKFYRLDDARTSNTGGAGLGLSIAKEIITLHGGTITARSENNTVTFIVTLPILNQEGNNPH